MQKIESLQISGWLKNSNSDYQIIGDFKKSYYISSIFEPVDNGFYFLTSKNNFLEVTNSVFIVTESFQIDLELNNNCYILIKADPQIIYYNILNFLFKRKSSGTIAPSTIIHPEAVIGNNVEIGAYTTIGKCIIEDNVIIGSHSVINDKTYIGSNTIIESHSVIGTQGVAWVWNEDESERIVQPQMGGVHIDSYCFLAANTIIVRGSLNEKTYIGKNTLLAPGCRIGHGSRIGSFVHFANSVVTGGNTIIGDYCFVGSAVTFRPKTNIHSKTIVGAGALVIKNTSKSGLTLMGVPATEMETKLNPAGMPKPKS